MRGVLRTNIWVIIYFTWFGLLFLQYPLHDSLPGKLDTWFYLNAFKSISNYILAFFTGDPVGTALYPEAALYLYGNYSFGQAVVFLPFKWLGLSDITAYYLFMVSLFTLNAWSVMKLAGLWIDDTPVAFTAGLIFASSNFMLANTDNPDAIFVAAGVLSIYLLWKWFENGRVRDIILCGVMAGLEVYLSSYAFLFTVILLGLTIGWNINKLRNGKQIVIGFLGFIMFGLVIWPYCSMYIFSDHLSGSFNPANSIKVADAVSLTWRDLISPLPHNLFYHDLARLDDNWLYKSKSAFLGFLIPLLGVAGWMTIRRKLWFIVAFVLFLLLAIGPYIGPEDAKAPFYFLYDKFHFHSLFRISIRAYYFCSLLLIIPAVFMANKLARKTQFPHLILSLLVLLILVENVPYKLRTYESAGLIVISESVPDFDNDAVILNLPSSIYSDHIEDFKHPCEASKENYEFEIIREYLYVYQQTLHKANVLNGFPGFIPDSRMQNQLWIQDISKGSNLKKLISSNDLNYIMWHKKLTNNCDHEDWLSFFNENHLLSKVSENEFNILYKCQL